MFLTKACGKKDTFLPRIPLPWGNQAYPHLVIHMKTVLGMRSFNPISLVGNV